MPYRDKEKKIKAHHRYMSTLTAYLKELYNSAKRRNKKSRMGRKIHHFDLEWIEFTNVFWNQVETLGGIYCAYTGQAMTHKRGTGRLGTNISLDRIDNTKGYTKDNIIFCTISFNDLKGSVTIDACQRILDVYKERIGYVEEDDKL